MTCRRLGKPVLYVSTWYLLQPWKIQLAFFIFYFFNFLAYLSDNFGLQSKYFDCAKLVYQQWDSYFYCENEIFTTFWTFFQDLLGCYQNLDGFVTYPGFINVSSLTPQLCIQACSISGNRLAAIVGGSYCFCKPNATMTSSNNVSLNNCEHQSNGSLVYTASYLSVSSTAYPILFVWMTLT